MPKHLIGKYKKKLSPVVFYTSVILVFCFFVITTLLMTMTGEDILHQNSTVQAGTLKTVENVYGFLPRIGEFFQKLSIQFYDYQTTLSNPNVFWRVLDALLCTAAIYLAAMVCLGRRLKPSLKDALVFLSIFAVFIMSPHNEVFMMRFSYLHNYIPILLAIAGTAYLMFNARDNSKYLPIVGGLTGLMLGMSSEIAPIVFLLMVAVYIAYRQLRHATGLKEIIKKSPTRTALILGAIIGLAIMLSNGAILERSGSAYGVVYGYVSIFGVFHDPLYTIARYIEHLIYNSRYLYMPLLAMVIIFATEVYMVKKDKKAPRGHVALQLSLLCFSVLYVLAASQIKVLDDLYPRFMSPVFLMVVISFVAFGARLVDGLKLRQRHIGVILLVPLTITLVAITDIAYGFGVANQLYKNELSEVKQSKSQPVCVIKASVEQRQRSPLFGFTQFTPFEEWTGDFGNNSIHGKELIYANTCP